LDIQQKGGRLPKTEKTLPDDGTGTKSVTWESPMVADQSEYMLSADWDLIKTGVIMTQKTYSTKDMATGENYTRVTLY